MLLCAWLSLGMALTSAAAAEFSPSAYGVGAVCPPPSPGYASCLALRLIPRAPLSIPGARALPDTASAPSHPTSASPDTTSAPAQAGATSEAAAPAVEQTEPIRGSLTPGELLFAYELPGTVAPASTQTIALVDAFDDVNAESDLKRYDEEFSLPACTQANECFRKVDEEGNSSPLPESSSAKAHGWAQEIATDVEMAHAVCQRCRILLVEANSESYSDLERAEQTATELGASEISNSWGGPEPGAESPAFNHPGVVITASAGDDGYRDWLGPSRYVSYPASSPHVVAVGGTRLLLQEPAGSAYRELVWNDGGENGGVKEGFGADGGGCSEDFAAPSWQHSLGNWAAVGCGEMRAVADVSADADPFTGVAVYDSTELEGHKGWSIIGGTSVASPIIAAAFALAGGAHGVAYPAQTLYENETKNPTSLHDVIYGSNGECKESFDWETESSRCPESVDAANCSGDAICRAGSGYDGPTGVGTPNGIGVFEPSKEAQLEGSHHAEEEHSGGSSGGGNNGSAQPGASPPVPAPIASPAPNISHLGLTLAALVALNGSHPRISQVGFAFDLNVYARVHVVLTRRVRKHGHTRWQILPGAFTIYATPGRNEQRLSASRTLGAGQYRLTLTPSGGAARWIAFQID
jgi:hypothetical protein